MTNPIFHQIASHVTWLAPKPGTDRPLLDANAGEAGSLVGEAGNAATHAQLLLEAQTGARLLPRENPLDKAWELRKFDTRTMLENGDESPASSVCLVSCSQIN